MLDGFKTIIGVLIAATPTFMSMFGFETSPDFTGDAMEIVAAFVTMFGAGMAIYGRLRAKAPGWFAKRS